MNECLSFDAKGFDCFLAGVILSGGQSRRMGTSKSALTMPDGRSMLDHVLDALRPLCSTVLLAGCGPEEEGLGPDDNHGVGRNINDDRAQGAKTRVLSLPDNYPGLGPLSGLEAALSSGLSRRYLVVCCDQPGLTPDLLKRLVENSRPYEAAFFQTGDGVLLPFPGLYPAHWLDLARWGIENREVSPHVLAPRYLAAQSAPLRLLSLLPGEEACVRSLNTPEEFRTFVTPSIGPVSVEA